MASYYRTQGIVLDKEDRGEADRVFTVFTKDFGKVRLRAVSARKITSKLRGGLELFYCSEIAFVQGKTHKTITDVVLLESYPNLRADIQSMRVAYRLAEIAEDLLKGQEKDGRAWNLLGETLSFLNRSGIGTQERNLVAYYFLWNLVSYAGYAPVIGDIAKENSKVAKVIQLFLERDTRALCACAINGTQQETLRKISQQHLLKIQES